MSKLVTRKDRLSFFNDRRTLTFLRLSRVLVKPVRYDQSVLKIKRVSERVLRNHKHTPASWERTTPLIRATYSTIILYPEMPSYFISLQLGPKKILAIKDKKRGAIDYVKREMSRKLTRVLGRSVEFWLHADIGLKGQHNNPIESLHVHGVIALDPGELKAVKKELLDISGDYYRPKALTLRPVNKPIGFVLGLGDYATRNSDMTSNLVPDGLYTCTRDLNDRARKLYTEHRQAYLELE